MFRCDAVGARPPGEEREQPGARGSDLGRPAIREQLGAVHEACIV